MFDPFSKETVGYHIFLEPEGELRDSLARTIHTLAEGYQGPVFAPHVTLLARIEDEDVLAKAEMLARETVPFSLALGALSGEPEFFRACYIRIEESGALHALHLRANTLFAMEDARTYVPHLSLYYGNIDEETRAAIFSQVSYPQASFEVTRLHVYETRGEASLWKKIASYELAG